MVISLPPFLFCFDRIIVSFLKNYYINKSAVYYVLEYADPFMNFISHGATLITISILLFIAGKFFNKKYYPAGKSLLVGVIASGVAAQIIKHLIGRERPRLTDSLVLAGPSFQGGYDSFPSGHTTVAFCMAHILSFHFPRYRVFFYLIATLIGLERVEGIAHFPSDVLAGAIIGMAIAKLLLINAFLSGAPALRKDLNEAAGRLADRTAFENPVE